MVTPENVLRGLWIAWWVSWMAAAAWSDRSVKRPGVSHQILYRVLAAIGIVLLFGTYRHAREDERILWYMPEAGAWLMVALTLAGLAFTWWARMHLGRLWSSNVARKAEHHLVDTGPYGIVRHPIYTGIIAASIGTAALRGTALAWVGAGVLTAGWFIKARLEESFLREQLGAQAYADYVGRVPMLVPFPRPRPTTT